MLDPNNTRIGYNPGDEGEFTPEDQIVRPAHSTSKSSKDFKKILGKGQRGKDEEEEEFASGETKKSSKIFDPEGKEASQKNPMGKISEKDDEENASQGGPVSLFELSSKSSQKFANKQKGVEETPKKVDSPAEMFRSSSKQTAKVESPLGETDTQKTKFTTRYTQEQPDLSYVNPMAATPAAPLATSPSNTVKNVTPVDNTRMIQLVEQIVKHLVTVRTEGRTDTVITLQYPPLFKDAQVVISAFDTARGQFNISFENLSQAAQNVISLEANKRALLDALHDKGYGVQIFTATTLVENAAPVDESIFRQNRERESGQQQQRDQEDQA